MPDKQPHLQATTVRFDPAVYGLVQEVAADIGITVSQFVREAALMRAILRATMMRERPAEATDDPGAVHFIQSLHEISEQVVRLSQVNRAGEGGRGTGSDH